MGKSANQNNIKIRSDREQRASQLILRYIDFQCVVLGSRFPLFLIFKAPCWIINTFHTFILYVDMPSYILGCSCHINQVRVFEVNTWHLSPGTRKQSCDLPWCPMWTLVSLRVPGVPCAASLWDYLYFTGHAKASWELSESRSVACHLQPLHWNTQSLRVFHIEFNFHTKLFKQTVCYVFVFFANCQDLKNKTQKLSWEWTLLPSTAFAVHTVPQFNTQKQLSSRWQQLHCLLKLCKKIFGRKLYPFGIILS